MAAMDFHKVVLHHDKRTSFYSKPLLISHKPGFYMILNGRRRSVITIDDHLAISAIDDSQTPHKCFHILLAIADQVIPQALICLVRNEGKNSQFSLGSY